MTDKLQKIGRLAFREEGENWNAYYADEGTMQDAIYLGSIKMIFVLKKERKEQFIALMRECFADHCEKFIGIRPTWMDPIPAPEHERSRTA